MANVKITELTAYTNPTSTDVVPIVDLVNDQTKKVALANIFQNFPDGTAGEPSIAFDGDSNTGIYRPGADQVAISTGGAGRLFVDESGNITQEASSPDLTVKDTQSHTSSDGPTLQFQGRGPNNFNYNFGFIRGVSSGVNNAGKLELGTNSAGVQGTAITILPGGNLGVGDNDPDARCVVYRPTQFAGNTVFAVKSDAGGTKSTLFEIDGDGGTEFTGDVDFGNWRASNNSQEGARIYAVGAVQVNRTSGGGAVLAGRLNGAVTTQITADGKATFADQIISGSSALRGSFKAFSPGANAGARCFLVQHPTDSSINYASINGDGSAEFAGDLDLGNWKASNNTQEGARIYSAGGIQANRTSAGGAILVGRLSGTVTTQITADGSAEFASRVEVTTADPNISCFKAVHSGGGNSEAIEVIDGTTKTATIKANGSAEFAGDVEVTGSAVGVVLKSPNGTRYRITVDNSGNLTTVAV